jgi:N-acetylglucosaminyl-diphospho-decaprenol L-rhamnosyltransferase
MGIFSEKNADPTYSLISVNYQSASALGRMLRSLPLNFFSQGEILIVNNDVTQSVLLARMFQGRANVRLVETKQNIGFAAACNRGAELARGSILLFLNPDVRLLSPSLEPWLQVCREQERVIVAPLLLQTDAEEAWSYGRRVSPLSLLLQNVLPFASLWSFFARQSLEWVSGAAWAVRKADFDLLGGFDETYFLYYEDVDLCRRATQAGFRIERSIEICFSHTGGKSHTEGKKKQKQAYFSSQDRYIRQYYGTLLAVFWQSLRRFRSFFLRTLC